MTTQMMTGAELIAAERQRQIEQEGWTAEHDDKHTRGELAEAAVCYTISANDAANNPQEERRHVPESWPWPPQFWKQTGDRIRDLTKAGALIAAEIDRLQRLEQPTPTGAVQWMIEEAAHALTWLECGHPASLSIAEDEESDKQVCYVCWLSEAARQNGDALVRTAALVRSWRARAENAEAVLRHMAKTLEQSLNALDSWSKAKSDLAMILPMDDWSNIDDVFTVADRSGRDVLGLASQQIEAARALLAREGMEEEKADA